MIFDRAKDILMLSTMHQKMRKKNIFEEVIQNSTLWAEIRFVGNILDVKHDFLKIFEKFKNFQ